MPAPSQIQPMSSAPTMARMADGTYVPASQPSKVLHGNHQKLLIFLQYYEGDKAEMEDLGSLIADLERVRNRAADIMVFRRFDASEFSSAVIQKLKDKFDNVYVETSRRRDAKGYPFGPNQMWSDIVTLMGQVPKWRDNYYAFLPLESDCTPLRPGWIAELIEEFKLAKSKNFAAVGHVHTNPIEHLNGVAVYDSNLWKIVGGNRLNGSDPQVPYDLYHRKSILPIAYNTPLVMMEYQRPTITAEDLFQPWKNGLIPAMFHGVKDYSAREAVRAKYVTMSGEKDVSGRTVFTYEHQKPNNPTLSTKYELWRDAWKSRGWNPVKLTLRDAARNPKYAGVMKSVEKMKFLGAETDMVARLVRWVALDSMGGGLMVDPEVLPNNFFPENFRKTPGLWSEDTAMGILAAYLDRMALNEYLLSIEKYQSDERLFAPELSVLKTASLFKKSKPKVAIYGQENWRSCPLVSFNQAEMQRIGAQGTSLQLMEKFLRET